MKKPALRATGANAYGCRTCKDDDFKNSMEFTKHLKRCRVLPVLPAPSLVTPALPLPTARQGSPLLPLLIDASQKAGELKHSLDALIKRLR